MTTDPIQTYANIMLCFRNDTDEDLLATYPTAWIHAGTSCDVQHMVESGFKYSRERDTVRCCVCNILLCDWNVSDGDTPKDAHIQFAPMCPISLTTSDVQSVAKVRRVVTLRLQIILRVLKELKAQYDLSKSRPPSNEIIDVTNLTAIDVHVQYFNTQFHQLVFAVCKHFYNQWCYRKAKIPLERELTGYCESRNWTFKSLFPKVESFTVLVQSIGDYRFAYTLASEDLIDKIERSLELFSQVPLSVTLPILPIAPSYPEPIPPKKDPFICRKCGERGEYLLTPCMHISTCSKCIDLRAMIIICPECNEEVIEAKRIYF